MHRINREIYPRRKKRFTGVLDSCIIYIIADSLISSVKAVSDITTDTSP